MLKPDSLSLFIPVMMLLVILPGPDFALVSRLALLEGKRAGQLAACGVSLGIMLHTALAIAGISAIIAASAPLFQMLKYSGAAYLFFLGLQSFMQNDRFGGAESYHGSMPKCQKVSLRLAFKQGFLCNVLNPKAMLIFFIMLPQFMTQNEPPAPQLLEMGIITALLCLAWYLFLAQALGKICHFFTKRGFRIWLQRLTGIAFLFFGFRLF